MKIAVFSDSHGICYNMAEIIRDEKPDMIIHCGDHQKDAQAIESEFPNIPVYSVAGNCDWGRKGEEEKLFEVMGKVFYITHGHIQNVKRGYMNLALKGKEVGADVVICGHTHIPMYDVLDNMYMINPGSITYGKKTYGIINITQRTFGYELKYFDWI